MTTEFTLRTQWWQTVVQISCALAIWVGGCDADLVLLQQVLSTVGDAPSIVLDAKGMLRPLWRHKACVLHQARPQCVCKILQQQEVCQQRSAWPLLGMDSAIRNHIRSTSAANRQSYTQMPQVHP